MIKYVLSKTIKHRRYEHTLFAGTNLDQTIILSKGTYVELIPVAYLDLFGNVNDCKNCSLVKISVFLNAFPFWGAFLCHN